MKDNLYQDESLVQFYDYDNAWLDSFDVNYKPDLYSDNSSIRT